MRSRSSTTATAARRTRSPTGSSATAALAEDVTQEAFLSMWRSGARFDAPAAASAPGRSGSSATGRSTRCAALRGKAPKLDLDDDAGARRAARRRAHRRRGDPARDRRPASAARCASFPDEQSQVIELAYFGGFSHSEIAAMLGMPLGTVKGRMRLGLEKIRVALAEGMGVERSSEVLP